MSAATTRVSAKGQVVIPKSVRDAQGWHAGTELIAEATEDGVLLRPRDAIRSNAAKTLLGCAGYQGPRRSAADMEAAIARGAAGAGRRK